MNVIKVECFPDGSAWSTVVGSKETPIAVLYCNGKLNVEVVPKKYTEAYVDKKYLNLVHEWAKEQVENLGPEWHRKHNEMYGVV